MKQTTTHFTRFAGALLFTTLVFCGSSFAGENRCISASTPDTLILPDGKSYEAEMLQICVDRSYSPVAGLHKLYIDGKPVGMFLSKRTIGVDDGTYRTATMEFSRNEDGAWVLESYTVPTDKQLIIYKMSDRAKNAVEAPTVEPVVVAVWND